MIADANNATFTYDARKAITKVRTRFLLEHPFFGSLAMRVRLVEDTACRDLWTNGKELGYNPAWVTCTNEATLTAALANAMLHLALGHHVRRKNRDPQRWNTACDYAVNLLLEEAGFSLSSHFLLDSRFAGMSAEAIFAHLPILDDQPPKGGAKRALQSKEQSLTDGTGSKGLPPRQNSPALEPQSLLSQRKGDTQPLHAKQMARPSPKNKPSKNSMEQGCIGEVRDHPALHDPWQMQAQEKAEEDAKNNLIMAMQRAFHEGDMPGSLQRVLRDRLAPQMNWRELLQRFLEMQVQNDSTWTHPNRRYIHQGLYLPSRSEPALKNLCLAIDSSGSIDEQQLARFFSELSAILAVYETSLIVITHDCVIQDVEIYNRTNLPDRILPKGGGGTDYRPVGEWIAMEGLHPVCLLWFTDLECSHFPDPPDCPVLWICPKGKQKPPFGEVVELN
ncbi:MAG: hypothetical protein IJS50_01465 [Desulfovibrio sp.]|nr:hypothetical protein [Desulfovibrio sp.]